MNTYIVVGLMMDSKHCLPVTIRIGWYPTTGTSLLRLCSTVAH